MTCKCCLLIQKGLHFIFRLNVSRFGEGYRNITGTSEPIVKSNSFVEVNIIDFDISKYTANGGIYRVIRNNCRGFNNLSYKICLR